MMENLHRDELTMSRWSSASLAPTTSTWRPPREILVRGRPERGRRRDEARAAIGHALAYTTGSR